MKKLFMTVLTLISLIGCTTENSVKTSSVAESSEVDVKNGVLMDKTFYNPLDLRQNMGDPWVFKHEGYYYYLHGGSNIRVIKSKWLTQLTPNINDANQSKIIFNQKSIDVVEVWAPELFFFEGHWYLYFTATQDIANTLAKDTARRTYGAKSKTADCFGEWEKAVKIDLPLDYRSIDATFMNYNGHQYIIYSGWPNATNSDWLQNLYITELEEGNPLRAKSTDEEARVLISEPQYEWEVREARQNEGPAYVSSPSGNPTLLYSASYSGGDKYC
ncbi:MAG: family 43 glycosylhydrolase, partial [Bacillales bacterium]|nr:family 43 glycosylhydrolase [Bacillales bacterium]